MEEICTRSGGMRDNGARRGRGTVTKWMDGRIVKEGTAGCGAHSAVLSTFRAAETLEEGSHRSWGVGVGGLSQGSRGGRSEEASPMELARLGREVSNDGDVRDSEDNNPIADSLGGNGRMLRGCSALSRETEKALALLR